MYKVQLDVFEGPLDLLLHLVEKNKLDICSISIAAITDQYIDYIEKAEKIDLDKIGEFLIIASLLMRIKVRQLLPRHQEDEEEEEVVREERDLVERLIEYRAFKEVTSYLEARLKGEASRVYFRPKAGDNEEEEPPVITATLKQLVTAYLNIEKRKKSEPEHLVLIPRGDVDVEEKMSWLMDRVSVGSFVFQDIIKEAAGRRERAALFLALLELVHRGFLAAFQLKPGGDIMVSKAEVKVC